MKKNIKFILVTLLLVAVMCVALVGCTKTPNLQGGDPNATTYNNNSLVVTQGDYIYFVNGKITLDNIATKKDNKYGNVTKSAIYRAKKDGSNPEVVVPQIAMDSNNANGISVLGGYIYFTSPAISTSKDGSLKKDNTDFYRVEISGKKLTKLLTLEGNTNQYKFTDSGLIYIADSKLMYLPYGGKSKVIAESVSNSYFPVTSTYTPGKADATMAVYFTESVKDEDGKADSDAHYNIMKCVTATGEVKEIMTDKEAEATYSLTSVEAETDENGNPTGEVAVYYNKSLYNNGKTINKGIFGIKVSNAFAKNAEEKQFAQNGATVRYISYNDGAYTFADNKMYIPKSFDEDGLPSEETIESYPLYNAEASSISNSNIFAIRKESDGKYIYFFDTDSLLKVKMLDNKLDLAVEVIAKNIVTDYVQPIINGDTFYYINSGYYNYIYKVNLVEENAKHSILGVRNAADKAAYIKYVKGLDEDARAEHDKLIAEDLPAEDLAKD